MAVVNVNVLLIFVDWAPYAPVMDLALFNTQRLA